MKEDVNFESKPSIEADICSVNISLSNLTLSPNESNADVESPTISSRTSVEPGSRIDSTESTNDDSISDENKSGANNNDKLLSHSNQVEEGVETQATIEIAIDAEILTDSAIEVDGLPVEETISLVEAVGDEAIIDETEEIGETAAEVSEIMIIKQAVEAAAESMKIVDVAESKVDSVTELELLVPPCSSVRSSSSQLSLKDCLSAFTREEVLSSSDNNGFYCTKCSPTKGLVDAKKRILLLDCPMMISIHLKRLLSGGKFSGHVDFSLELNIKDFKAIRKDVHKKEKNSDDKFKVTEDSTQSTSNVDDSKSDEDMTDTDNNAIDIDNGQTESNFEDDFYDLCAVIVHQGGSLGGHYVSHVRNKKGDWYYCSDTTVRSSTEADALRAQAYMLYYQRRDINFDSLHGIDNDAIGDNANTSEVVNENIQNIENEGDLLQNVENEDEIIATDGGENILNNDNENITVSDNDENILVERDTNRNINAEKCTTTADDSLDLEKTSSKKGFASKGKQTKTVSSNESHCDVSLDLNIYSSTKDLARRLKKSKEIGTDESTSRTRLSRKCKVGP